jgi:acyl-CoA synthetase (AMP-forming)/AMP-acid ligase II
LDLSSVRVVINGAEPIHESTLRAFENMFAVAKFPRNVFQCAYGMAENVCAISGSDLDLPRVVLKVDRTTLEEEQRVVILPDDTEQRDASEFMGLGRPVHRTTVIAVDPETREELGEDHVGEIWVRSPSLGSGYFNNPTATEETFEATLNTKKPKRGALKWMRSGDYGKFCSYADVIHSSYSHLILCVSDVLCTHKNIGFIHDGQLFLTSRLKDLIIIRGRNIAPQDIEHSVQNASELIRPGCVAAFSVDDPNGSKVQNLVACSFIYSLAHISMPSIHLFIRPSIHSFIYFTSHRPIKSLL